MVLDLEYLEEAVIEAEKAAQWYAARSATAVAGFVAELVAAESAIIRLPNAWPQYEHGTRRFLLRRYPFGVVYLVDWSSPRAFSSWPSLTGIDGPGIGEIVFRGLAGRNDSPHE